MSLTLRKSCVIPTYLNVKIVQAGLDIKENLVIPISIENNSNSSNDIVWFAIANYSYLGVLSDFIKHRIKQDLANIEIIFIEKSREEIEEMLDKVSTLSNQALINEKIIF